METPSAPAHRGSMAWHLSLLTASLLTFWNPSTTAQPLNVVMVPSKAVKGKEVLLFARNMPEYYHTTWYKGAILNDNKIITRNSEGVIFGPKHNSRKRLFENGSLLIQNLILEDTGNYTIQVLTKKNDTISGKGQLRVNEEEEGTTGMPVWTFLSILIGVLFGVKLTALVGYFLFLRFRRNPGQHDSRQLQPTSGSLEPGAPSSSSSQST